MDNIVDVDAKDSACLQSSAADGRAAGSLSQKRSLAG